MQLNISIDDGPNFSPEQLNETRKKKKTRRVQVLNDSKDCRSFFVNVRQGNPRRDDEAGNNGNLRRSLLKKHGADDWQSEFLKSLALHHVQTKDQRSENNLVSERGTKVARGDTLDISVGTIGAFNAAISIEKHSTPRGCTNKKTVSKSQMSPFADNELKLKENVCEVDMLSKKKPKRMRQNEEGMVVSDFSEDKSTGKKKKHKHSVQDVDVEIHHEVEVQKKKKKKLQVEAENSGTIVNFLGDCEKVKKKKKKNKSGEAQASIDIQEMTNTTKNSYEEAFVVPNEISINCKKKKRKSGVQNEDTYGAVEEFELSTVSSEHRKKSKKKHKAEQSLEVDDSRSAEKDLIHSKAEEEMTDTTKNSYEKAFLIPNEMSINCKKKKRKGGVQNEDTYGAVEELELSTVASEHRKKSTKKHKAEQSLEVDDSRSAEKDLIHSKAEKDVSKGAKFGDSCEVITFNVKRKKQRTNVNEDTEGKSDTSREVITFKTKRKKQITNLNEDTEGNRHTSHEVITFKTNVNEDTEGKSDSNCEVITFKTKKKKQRTNVNENTEGKSDSSHEVMTKKKKRKTNLNEDMEGAATAEEGKKGKRKNSICSGIENLFEIWQDQDSTRPKETEKAKIREKNKPAAVDEPKIKKEKKRHLNNEDLYSLDQFNQAEDRNEADENPAKKFPEKDMDCLFAQMEKSYENKLIKKEKKDVNDGSQPDELLQAINNLGDKKKCSRQESEIETKIKVEDSNIEKLNNLTIYLPFLPPPLHTIETRMSTRPTKEQLEQIQELHIPVRKGKFLKSEDATIEKNWMDFCKRHNLPDNKEPFLKFVHAKVSLVPVLRYEERIKFVQYLARGLDDRLLWTVYTRFQTMYTPTVKGNFSPEEDKIIINYMQKHKGDFKTFSVLSGKLQRQRLVVEKRYRDLLLKKKYESPEKRKRTKKEIILQAVMQHFKVQDVQKLRDRKIKKEDWKVISADVKMLPFNTRKVWLTTVYPSLFSVERRKFIIVQNLVDMIYESGATDRNEVKYADYEKCFEGCTKEALSRWFNRYLKFVPDEINGSFRDKIKYLKECYFPYNFVYDSIRHIDESCKVEDNDD